MHAYNEERVALIEQIMQQGPGLYLHQELQRITELARETGLERDDVAMALMTHAVALCLPDFASRGALASVLRKEARKLAPTDEEFVRW